MILGKRHVESRHLSLPDIAQKGQLPQKTNETLKTWEVNQLPPIKTREMALIHFKSCNEVPSP